MEVETVEELAQEKLDALALNARVAEAAVLLKERNALNARMAFINIRLQELNAGAVSQPDPLLRPSVFMRGR